MNIFIKGNLDTLNLFIDEMAKGAEKAEILDLRDTNAFTDALIRLDPDINEMTRVITFNNIGTQLKIGGSPYWSSKGVRLFNILVDHPAYYVEAITQNYYPGMELICVDKGHKDFLCDILPAIKENVHFIPHGGAYAAEHKDKRDIDILYIGGFHEEAEIKEPEIPFLDSRDFYDFVRKYYESEEYAEVQYAVRAYEVKRGIIFNAEQKYLLTRNTIVAAEWHYIKKERIRLIRYLSNAGLKINLYGGDEWKDIVPEFGDNVLFGGKISARECLELTGRTKILLNLMPCFADGAHERVFNGMLNGAVVVTNRSRYLENRFKDGEDIVYFDKAGIMFNNKSSGAEKDFINKIKRLLGDEACRMKIAGNAFDKVKEDTWRVRAAGILLKGTINAL